MASIYTAAEKRRGLYTGWRAAATSQHTAATSQQVAATSQHVAATSQHECMDACKAGYFGLVQSAADGN